MTIKQLVKKAKKPDLVKILIMHQLKLDEKMYFLNFDKKLSFWQIRSLERKIGRLDLDEPVQYINKTAHFYAREFSVNKNVLIPRPETEILLQKAKEFLELRMMNNESWVKDKNIIDIGTGSGCIVVSLAKELKPVTCNLKTNFYATDISNKALEIAKANAKKHHTQVKFFKSDLLKSNKLPEKFDLILANLPYLKSDYKEKLTGENHTIILEPKSALDGGIDGLDIIKELIQELPNRLEKNGIAILEVGEDQQKDLEKISKNFKTLEFEYLRDLAGKFRFVKISRSA